MDRARVSSAGDSPSCEAAKGVSFCHERLISGRGEDGTGGLEPQRSQWLRAARLRHLTQATRTCPSLQRHAREIVLCPNIKSHMRLAVLLNCRGSLLWIM